MNTYNAKLKWVSDREIHLVFEPLGRKLAVIDLDGPLGREPNWLWYLTPNDRQAVRLAVRGMLGDVARRSEVVTLGTRPS